MSALCCTHYTLRVIFSSSESLPPTHPPTHSHAQLLGAERALASQGIGDRHKYKRWSACSSASRPWYLAGISYVYYIEFAYISLYTINSNYHSLVRSNSTCPNVREQMRMNQNNFQFEIIYSFFVDCFDFWFLLFLSCFILCLFLNFVFRNTGFLHSSVRISCSER